MSLASTQADVEVAVSTLLSNLATSQATYKFLNGRYWHGTKTHTNLPVDGSSSSADLSSSTVLGENKSWDEMVGTVGSIPCSMECRSYKKALYSLGHGYVVKLKFIYGGTVYEKSIDSGYDSSESRSWAASGTASFDPPVIDSISPSTGGTGGGTSITLTGSGFIVGGTTTVTVGGSAATSVSVVSSTSITCTTPSGTAGAKDVVITNTDGQSYTYSSGFTYSASVSVTSVDVSSGTSAGGTVVTLTGTGFASGGSITFGGVAGTSYTFLSSTSARATTPSHNYGVVDVKYINADTTEGTLTNGFTYTATAVTYNSGSGNWTVPSNVTTVQIEVWGAGGGGGGGGAGSGSNGASGGAGGGYCKKNALTVTPGSTISYVVGAGGAGGGTDETDGVAGGNSSANSGAYVANGGAKGINGEGSHSGSTAGGTASGGDTNTTGGSGTGVAAGNNGGAGGAGANGGAGGAGGVESVSAAGNGTAPGGGGGGGAKPDMAGGAGAAGRVTFTY